MKSTVAVSSSFPYARMYGGALEMRGRLSAVEIETVEFGFLAGCLVISLRNSLFFLRFGILSLLLATRFPAFLSDRRKIHSLLSLVGFGLQVRSDRIPFPFLLV